MMIYSTATNNDSEIAISVFFFVKDLLLLMIRSHLTSLNGSVTADLTAFCLHDSAISCTLGKSASPPSPLCLSSFVRLAGGF